MNVPFSNWLLLIDKKAIDFCTLILDELKLFRIVFHLLFSDFSEHTELMILTLWFLALPCVSSSIPALVSQQS